jgi:Na+-translocating ferredoxin:NAD+ oxidoreductase RNF subunit RnfB
MDIFGIIKACLIVGGTGLLIGVLLGIADKFLAVKKNEQAEKIRELLPGNNCGGCGFPGCDGLAEAISKNEASPSACPVGGEAVAKGIGEILGVSVDVVRKVAFVKCNGTCEHTTNKYEYSGNMTCVDAVYVSGNGPKSCEYGCLGYGSCVSVCDRGAINIVNGVAVVDKDKCFACGKCVKACPKGLIEIVPYDMNYHVACSSKDKGKDVKSSCKTGCIGCKICERNCASGAITVEDNLASIDYDKCTNCGLCATKCPSKIIM